MKNREFIDGYQIKNLSMLVELDNGTKIEIFPPEASYVKDPFSKHRVGLLSPNWRYVRDPFPEDTAKSALVEEIVRDVNQNCFGIKMTQEDINRTSIDDTE